MKSRRWIVAVVPVVLTACVSVGSRNDAEVAEEIEIMGTWRDEEADRFADVLAPFESVSGIDIRYVGSGDFVSDLRQRATEGADPPDIAVIPQPGVIEQLQEQGLLVPLPDAVREIVLGGYELDAVDDPGADFYTVPFRLTVKSLIWYRPEVFEEHGWEIPDTLAELEALVDTIEEESDLAPWCFSIEAGSATGWAATDWVEDLVLRTAGPDVYQDWIDGEVAFADEEIADAFTLFHDLVLASGRSAGGARAIVERPVDQAWVPMLDLEAGCAMYKQADFATSWMPPDIEIGPDGDVDFFAMPGASADDLPIVVGGDQIVQFRSSDEIDEVMAYLAGPRSASIWVRKGGFISANPSVSDDEYPDRYRASITNAVDRASDLVLDASDSMPPDVGSELLWSQITLWVAGAIDYDTFAATVDEAMEQARADG